MTARLRETTSTRVQDRSGVRVRVTEFRDRRGISGTVVEADCSCYGSPRRVHWPRGDGRTFSCSLIVGHGGHHIALAADGTVLSSLSRGEVPAVRALYGADAVGGRE